MKKSLWSRIFIGLLIGLPILYILVGFFVAPIIAKNVIEKRIAESVGHDIAVNSIRINPLEFTISAENIAINDPERGPLISLQRLFVDFEIISLFMDTTVVARVILEQPWVNIVLAPDGELNLARLAPEKEQEEPQSTENSKSAKPLLIESIAIQEASILFEDLSNPHPVRHIFEPINIELEQVSTQIDALGLSEINILTEDGEKAIINTQFSLEPLSIKSNFDIANFNLKRINTHLEGTSPVAIDNGRFDLTGQLMLNSESDVENAFYFKGGVKVNELAISDLEANPVLGFAEMTAPSIDVSLADAIAAIDSINLSGLWLETGLDENGQPTLASADSTTAKDSEKKSDSTSDSTFQFHLGEFNITDGRIKIDDQSVSPSVYMELSEFSAQLKNITNLTQDSTSFTINTVVNNTAKAHTEGEIKPFASSPHIDLKIDLEGYDLIKMSPYAGKFIGYEIDRGTFGLAAQYKIVQGTLEANHDILISNLTLGESVDSEDAVKAPIPLALSLLEDTKNRIKLKLPVEGDLNSPEFNFGSVIRTSFTNLITKLVASPFSILGSIAGVKGENLDYVGFQPGAAQLNDTEQTKLSNILQALKDRPRLVLTLHPTIDKKADMLALKTNHFDAQIKQSTKGKQHGHDPRYLKKLYKKRFGSKAYSKKVDNFKANEKGLDNPEVKLIESLRQDLIDEQPLEESDLDELANQRAQNVQQFLTEHAQISTDRLKIGKLQTADSADTGIVENKFSLNTQ